MSKSKTIKIIAIIRRQAHILNLSISINNKSGYLKQLTIVMEVIQKIHKKEIDKANEKVVDT